MLLGRLRACTGGRTYNRVVVVVLVKVKEEIGVVVVIVF
jgi:hypothetical protein